jgi:hypothetical protein
MSKTTTIPWNLGPVPEYMKEAHDFESPARPPPHRLKAVQKQQHFTESAPDTGAPEATAIYTQARLADLEHFLEAVGATAVIEAGAFTPSVIG